jgi:hypothetical protein
MWKQPDETAQAQALEEEQQRAEREREIRRTLAEPGEGYGSVGPLLPGELRICMRCSAVVFGNDRHDAWHASASR